MPIDQDTVAAVSDLLGPITSAIQNVQASLDSKPAATQVTTAPMQDFVSRQTSINQQNVRIQVERDKFEAYVHRQLEYLNNAVASLKSALNDTRKEPAAIAEEPASAPAEVKDEAQAEAPGGAPSGETPVLAAQAHPQAGADKALDPEKSAAPGASARAPAAAGQDGPTPVLLAGKAFASRDELDAHIRRLQQAVPDNATVDRMRAEDMFFLFHLCTFHPKLLDKLSAPVVGLKFGPREVFHVTRSIYLVFADGAHRGISLNECIDVVFPSSRRGHKRERDMFEGQAFEGGGGEPSKPAEDTDKDTPPPQKKHRELQNGCIVAIEGLPAGIPHSDLRQSLGCFGDVRFLEFVRPPKESSAPMAKDDDSVHDDESKEDGESEDGSAVEEAGGETTAEPAKPEPKADAGGEGPKVAATREASEEAPKEAPKVAPKEAHKEEPKERQDAPQEAPQEQASKDQARARFGSPDAADKCAAEFKEIDGCAITCRVLKGEEERAFFERMFEQTSKRRDKGAGKGKDKGKGKGKDKDRRKDRGKDKGKGKGKGKGKDKGKGRERRDDKR